MRSPRKIAGALGFEEVDSDAEVGSSGSDEEEHLGLEDHFFGKSQLLEFSHVVDSGHGAAMSPSTSGVFSPNRSAGDVSTSMDMRDDSDDDGRTFRDADDSKKMSASTSGTKSTSYSLMSSVSAEMHLGLERIHHEGSMVTPFSAPDCFEGTMSGVFESPSMHFVPSTPEQEGSIAVARARAVHHQVRRAQAHHEEHHRLLARQDEAAMRRDYKHKQSVMLLASMWRSLILATRFASRLRDPRSARAERALGTVRRMTRNMRLKQLTSMPRPTVAHLKTDKLLSLFPDHHLQKFIRRMTPRYYFSGETVIFQNCVEDETFVLCKGTVDVVVSKVVVSTISTPGTVLGAMGMISGEPRTASIIARTNCIFWSGNRLGFDVFSTQTTAATKFITEQRNANFRQVHETKLSSGSLAGYPLLQGISPEGLKSLCECGEPLIPKHKRAMLLPPTDTLASSALLLLAGKVTLVLRRSNAQSADKLTEALAWAADFSRSQKNYLRAIPQKQRPDQEALSNSTRRPSAVAEVPEPPRNVVSFPFQIANLLKFLKFQTDHGLRFANTDHDCDDGVDEDSREDQEKKKDSDDEADHDDSGHHGDMADEEEDSEDEDHFFNSSQDYVPIAEVSAPCFINLASMSIRKWLGLGAIARSNGVEALLLRRERVLDSLPVDDLSRLSENALKTNFKLIKVPDAEQLPRILCENQRFAAALPLISKLSVHLLRLTPFSIAEGAFLEFSAKHDRKCFIVTRGELVFDDAAHHGLPWLWPELPVVFFGADDRVIKSRTHVEGVSFRRSAFLKILNRGIREHDKRKAFFAMMGDMYHTLTMHAPRHLVDEDILDESWFTFAKHNPLGPTKATADTDAGKKHDSHHHHHHHHHHDGHGHAPHPHHSHHHSHNDHQAHVHHADHFHGHSHGHHGGHGSNGNSAAQSVHPTPTTANPDHHDFRRVAASAVLSHQATPTTADPTHHDFRRVVPAVVQSSSTGSFQLPHNPRGSRSGLQSLNTSSTASDELGGDGRKTLPGAVFFDHNLEEPPKTNAMSSCPSSGQESLNSSQQVLTEAGHVCHVRNVDGAMPQEWEGSPPMRRPAPPSDSSPRASRSGRQSLNTSQHALDELEGHRQQLSHLTDRSTTILAGLPEADDPPASERSSPSSSSSSTSSSSSSSSSTTEEDDEGNIVVKSHFSTTSLQPIPIAPQDSAKVRRTTMQEDLERSTNRPRACASRSIPTLNKEYIPARHRPVTSLPHPPIPRQQVVVNSKGSPSCVRSASPSQRQVGNASEPWTLRRGGGEVGNKFSAMMEPFEAPFSLPQRVVPGRRSLWHLHQQQKLQGGSVGPSSLSRCSSARAVEAQETKGHRMQLEQRYFPTLHKLPPRQTSRDRHSLSATAQSGPRVWYVGH